MKVSFKDGYPHRIPPTYNILLNIYIHTHTHTRGGSSQKPSKRKDKRKIIIRKTNKNGTKRESSVQPSLALDRVL